MAVQLELRTKVDDRIRCGMKSVPATSLTLLSLLLLVLVALVVKNPPANAGDARDVGSIPGLGRSPRREWQSTAVFWSEESHRQRSLAGYSPWGHKESDMTERLSVSTALLRGKFFLS